MVIDYTTDTFPLFFLLRKLRIIEDYELSLRRIYGVKVKGKWVYPSYE